MSRVTVHLPSRLFRVHTVTKLAILLALDFAQGPPLGVQATALPLLLRERGAAREAVGFANLL